MKLLFIPAGILAAGCACWGITEYATLTPFDVEATIAFDKTDSMPVQPAAPDVLANLGITKNKWQGLKITTTTINAYDYNPVHTALLPSRISLFSNPRQRDKEISLFTRQVTMNIDTITKHEDSLLHSSIYKYLVREVNRLSTSPAKSRKLFMFSDLEENSSFFSIYNRDNFLSLETHPEEVQKLFLTTAKLANLRGVEIHFVYEPRSEKDNERFMLMSNLFKEILTDAGASVFVEANITSL